MDDYTRNKIITELENNLLPIQQEFGTSLPADYVKAAINSLDGLSNFPGDKLAVSKETPEPNPAFFQRLCSRIHLVYTNLMGDGINATKQDIKAVLCELKQVSIAP